VSWVFFFFPVILENNTLTENLTNNNSLYNGITSSKTNLIIFVKKSTVELLIYTIISYCIEFGLVGPERLYR